MIINFFQFRSIISLSPLRRICFQCRLFVCLFFSLSLFVSNITQNAINRLRWNFMEGYRVVKGISDYILVVIWFTIQLWRRLALSECSDYEDCVWKVTDDLVVIAGVSVTWNILSWSESHKFKPWLGWTWGAWYFCPTWTKHILLWRSETDGYLDKNGDFFLFKFTHWQKWNSALSQWLCGLCKGLCWPSDSNFMCHR